LKSIRDPKARDRVVTAARHTIAELGIHGATVRAIANAGGVSTGSVMHYFADKDEIAHAVLDETNRIAGRRVRAAGKDKRGLEQLRAVVEVMLPTNRERLLDWRIWVAFWAEAQDTPGGSHGLNAAGLSLGSVVVDALTTAIEDGELPPTIDVGFEAGRIVTVTAGLGLMSGYGSAAQIKRIATRTLDAHLADLQSRAGAHV
jgi:AcrR family transcriptional regulator